MVKSNFSETTVILGIPVDNLDLEEALERIFSMAEAYELDGRPRLGVAVDTDTVIHLHTSAKHPSPTENLMNTLRQSDLMIPIGRPVGWAARIVGTRLKEQFSRSRFFRMFFGRAGEKGKRLFLLGNDAGPVLREESFAGSGPAGVRIAGAARLQAPGGRSPDRDFQTRVLERINASAIDFLLLDLRDPAAGTWFARHRRHLYVPLTLVVTGLQEFLRQAAPPETGRQARGPLPVSRMRLHVARIWRHLFYSTFMFGLTILPLVFYQQYRQAARRLFSPRVPAPFVKSRISRDVQKTAIKIISLPDPLDASVIGEIKEELKQMIRQAPKIVFDLSRVKFIDSSGLGLLLSLWRTAAAKNREIFLVGIRPPVYRFLRLSRTLDFFEKSMCVTIEDVIDILARRSAASSFYYLAVIRGNAAIFHMYGELDAPRVIDIDFNALTETIGGRNAVFNLSGLDFIDSAGTHLFIKIQRYAARHGRICILCGLRQHVRRMFQILRLERLFTITENIFGAELVLRRLERDANDV